MSSISLNVNDPVYGSDNYYEKTKSSTGKPAPGKPTHSTHQAHANDDDKSQNHIGLGNKRIPCTLCKTMGHRLFQCKDFLTMNVDQRLEFVAKNKLCFNCFHPSHRSGNCRLQSFCKVSGCKYKHSSLLHRYPQSEDTEPKTPEVRSALGGTQVSVCVPMVKVIVNNTYHTWALLDTGSTSSFIFDGLAKRLNLSGKPYSYTLNTLTCRKEINTELINVEISGSEKGNPFKLEDLILTRGIPAQRPSIKIDRVKYEHLREIPLPDELPRAEAEILLGMDHIDLIKPIEVRCGFDKGSPSAILTPLGWSICGPVSDRDVAQFVTMSNCVAIEPKLERLWEIERDGDILKAPSVEDRQVIELWDDETNFVNGHYVVPIPWREGRPCFPSSKLMCEKRLNYLNDKIAQKGLRPKYSENIEKMLVEGYAEPVPEAEIQLRDDSVWYIPHHPVLNVNKPGKVRVVFDCAARVGGVSLNNQCYSGPDLTNRLFDVLLGFRQYEHALTADVEAMYLQVRIPEYDRNSLRFLWDVNESETRRVEYRMTSHLFGAVFCAASSTYALRKAIDQFAFNDEVKRTVHRSMYVDDLLKSFKTEQEAVEIGLGCKTALKKGGFNLTKFSSNSDKVLDQIPDKEKASPSKLMTEQPESRALGIKWDINSDSFYYSSSLSNPKGVITKRIVLSQLASVYDPLGLVAPIIHKGKIIFQKATSLKMGWDATLPPNLQDEWKLWLDNLAYLPNLRFTRCICPNEFVDGVAELHHFSDASNSGYGACSYLRIINSVGKISVTLLTSKSRLAPLNHVTIPRLELCAAVLSAKLDTAIKATLDISIVSTTFWTDSNIVLAYINNTTRRFKVFVGNRISTIREASEPSQWRHVPSKNNAADILSRGCNAECLPHTWVLGPSFLHRHKSEWTTSAPDICEILKDDAEIKNNAEPYASENTNENNPLDRLIDHYSSLSRLKKAVCVLVKFKTYLKNRDMFSRRIACADLNHAESLLMQHVQAKAYSAEINALRQGKCVKCSSPLRKLNPVIDQNGILVVGGRLKNSNLSHRQKHPIILPYKNKLSKLIILEVHCQTHLGVEWVLGEIRLRYWIIKARNLVKAIKHACVTCKKLYANTQSQKLGDLLAEQTDRGKPPFTYTGVDLFGPFYVKIGRCEVKRYGCVFTCLTMRAIHLEVLVSLETDAFLNGLFRFISRRCIPSKIFSDNGTNLVGANTELRKSLKELSRTKIVEEARAKNIEWIFNPPLASHRGGAWERMIRTVRRIMCALLGRKERLTDDILSTVFCRVENIVNSRPITKSSDDPNDDVALTPNHLLLCQGNPSVNWGVFSSGDMYVKKWRFVQSITDRFWDRWCKEYLTLLHARQKWQQPVKNLKPGDLVLVQDVNVPRGLWPLGLVTEIRMGRDNLVRSVRIKTKLNELTRPVTKLVLLEDKYIWD